MKPTIANVVLSLGISASVMAQQPHSIHISLTPRSNISTSKLGKELEHNCPAVDVASDSAKAAYNLEASDMGRARRSGTNSSCSKMDNSYFQQRLAA